MKFLTAYTDYPLFKKEFGKLTPIRKVIPLHFDGDKYVTICYKGNMFSIKYGYLYTHPTRIGNGELYPVELLPIVKL